MRVGGDGAGAGGHSSPTPGPGSAALGAGRRRERGARGRGREECDREGARGAGARLCGGAHGERGNVEPELPSCRRAALGDVTALESEECRAAGAPSAGPGEVAHF